MTGTADTRVDQTAERSNTAELRAALARFASGVTVITTLRGGHEPGVHGMTANAFTSVSLSPPLVLVSIATSATTNQRIVDTGRYGISVLDGAQAEVSRHFAGCPSPRAMDFVWRDGLPLVPNALAHLTCTVRDSHPAGDHVLHVGEVVELWYRDGAPLVFYGGKLSSWAPNPSDLAHT